MPTPDRADDTPPPRRVPLHVVPQAAPTTTDRYADNAPAAADTPEPVVPQAPLDQRVLAWVGDVMGTRPRWSQPAPTMADTWAYSRGGDWATSDQAIRRVPHALLVLAAFAVTYPVEWAVHAVRTKPVGFVLAILLTIIATHIL